MRLRKSPPPPAAAAPATHLSNASPRSRRRSVKLGPKRYRHGEPPWFATSNQLAEDLGRRESHLQGFSIRYGPEVPCEHRRADADRSRETVRRSLFTHRGTDGPNHPRCTPQDRPMECAASRFQVTRSRNHWPSQRRAGETLPCQVARGAVRPNFACGACTGGGADRAGISGRCRSSRLRGRNRRTARPQAVSWPRWPPGRLRYRARSKGVSVDCRYRPGSPRL